MNKWEYRTVEFAQVEKKGMGLTIAADPAYRPRWVDGEQLKNWESEPPFREYLASLGEDGWEYAGRGPNQHGGFLCVFKRPRT
jgi:hypothetical protein